MAAPASTVCGKLNCEKRIASKLTFAQLHLDPLARLAACDALRAIGRAQKAAAAAAAASWLAHGGGRRNQLELARV